MSSKCTYLVTIGLPRKSALVGSYNYPYKEGSSSDTFRFFRKKIEIQCVRSVNYAKNTILDNPQNTIYRQIVKALMVHFLSNTTDARINGIKVVRVLQRKANEIKVDQHYKPNEQPLPIINSALPPISSAIRLLGEDENATWYRNVVEHWIKGVTTDDIFLRFESMWRSFERMTFYGNRNHPVLADRKKEMIALRKMRENLINHSARLTNSFNLADSYTVDDITIFRWREYMNNDFTTTSGYQKDCENYRDFFVNPNNDPRVVELIRRTYVNIQKKAVACGMDADLQAIIAGKTNVNKINHELVAVLLCRYAYFHRNKVFHGETISKSLFLPQSFNADEPRVLFLNTLLENTVRDCLENFSLF